MRMRLVIPHAHLRVKRLALIADVMPLLQSRLRQSVLNIGLTMSDQAARRNHYARRTMMVTPLQRATSRSRKPKLPVFVM